MDSDSDSETVVNVCGYYLPWCVLLPVLGCRSWWQMDVLSGLQSLA